ncbi:hypothetical protein DFH08DRAFT_827566 [Mycena albidolilacea]|uniref:AVL9/DENND6 domain-containing protein n=1 Tax=Mycena albidolilacea TaxID=1033008 RepID=A0AAD7E781_9AGAR|nr:hypothetical protein DFH08DRAFT_827566 [Mycena albidolilacea]
MFYGHPVERLCTYQYSLVSLLPGLLQTLDDCGSPPLAACAPTLSRPTSLKTSAKKIMMAYAGVYQAPPRHLRLGRVLPAIPTAAAAQRRRGREELAVWEHQLDRHRKKGDNLLDVDVGGALLANLGATALLTVAGIRNYLGGYAMAILNTRTSGPVNSGASLFTHVHVPPYPVFLANTSREWVCNKTENPASFAGYPKCTGLTARTALDTPSSTVAPCQFPNLTNATLLTTTLDLWCVPPVTVIYAFLCTLNPSGPTCTPFSVERGMTSWTKRRRTEKRRWGVKQVPWCYVEDKRVNVTRLTWVHEREMYAWLYPKRKVPHTHTLFSDLGLRSICAFPLITRMDGSRHGTRPAPHTRAAGSKPKSQYEHKQYHQNDSSGNISFHSPVHPSQQQHIQHRRSPRALAVAPTPALVRPVACGDGTATLGCGYGVSLYAQQQRRPAIITALGDEYRHTGQRQGYSAHAHALSPRYPTSAGAGGTEGRSLRRRQHGHNGHELGRGHGYTGTRGDGDDGGGGRGMSLSGMGMGMGMCGMGMGMGMMGMGGLPRPLGMGDVSGSAGGDSEVRANTDANAEESNTGAGATHDSDLHLSHTKPTFADMFSLMQPRAHALRISCMSAASQRGWCSLTAGAVARTRARRASFCPPMFHTPEGMLGRDKKGKGRERAAMVDESGTTRVIHPQPLRQQLVQ